MPFCATIWKGLVESTAMRHVSTFGSLRISTIELHMKGRVEPIFYATPSYSLPKYELYVSKSSSAFSVQGDMHEHVGTLQSGFKVSCCLGS